MFTSSEKFSLQHSYVLVKEQMNNLLSFNSFNKA